MCQKMDKCAAQLFNDGAKRNFFPIYTIIPSGMEFYYGFSYRIACCIKRDQRKARR